MTHMCFLAFSHQHFSFQSHRLLFSHASAKVRGGNTAERKFASTRDRIHNHQVMSPTRSPVSHPGRDARRERESERERERERERKRERESLNGKRKTHPLHMSLLTNKSYFITIFKRNDINTCKSINKIKLIIRHPANV